MKVLFHADGDALRGTGHLVRLLGVALELADRIEAVVSTSTPDLARRIGAQFQDYFGREVKILPCEPASTIPESWEAASPRAARGLAEQARTLKPDWVVVDGKYRWSQEELRSLKSAAKLALLDHAPEVARDADWVVYPTSHSDPARTRAVPAGKLRSGPEWTWLHPAVTALRAKLAAQIGENPARKKYDALVSMGGADPNRRTLEIMRWIAEQPDLKDVAIFLGSAFSHHVECLALGGEFSEVRWDFLEDGKDLHSAMAASNLVISAMGITAYESYALGVPILLVPHGESDAKDVEMFLRNLKNAGHALNLGGKLAGTSFAVPDAALASRLGGLAENLFALLGR